MENESLNDTQESETNLDTSRSSTSEESNAAVKTRTPYALHLNNDDKENTAGDSKNTTPNKATGTLQNKGASKKPSTPTEASAPNALRAPYAQPVLDASKFLNGGDSRRSTVEERLASARERRIQQQRQLELGFMLRKEREDQAHAKWMQSQEDKRKKIEESRMKDDAHRKEVELRKKQQIDDERKKAEAKVAKTEQVYEVKMRQKRNSSSDRGKRWSWGGGGGGGGGGWSGGDTSPFHYFDPTRMTKRTPHSTDSDTLESNRSGSLSNLVSPSNSKPRVGDDRFSKSPLLVNTTHMAFASGLRSYDSSPNSVRGSSTGRPVTASGLTEQCSISPRLLAPTRASLARSRTAVNEIDDAASQSSNASSTYTGPMRSRSKDRKLKDRTCIRPETGSASSSPRVDGIKSTPPLRKPTPERRSTPTGTRGASPSLATRRRPPSPATTPSASSGSDAKKATDAKPEADKTPKSRPHRPPSPAKPKRAATPDATPTTPRTPTGTAANRPASPSSAASSRGATPKTKAQTDSSRTTSTPPNIKPSLRTNTTQLKTRSSPATTKTPTTKTTKPTNPKTKPETPKASEKAEKAKKTEEKQAPQKEKDVKAEVHITPSGEAGKEEKITDTTLSVTTELPKSLSNTSQAVSDIPYTSEAEEREVSAENPDISKIPESVQDIKNIEVSTPAAIDMPSIDNKESVDVPKDAEATNLQDSGVGDSIAATEPPSVASKPDGAGESLVATAKAEAMPSEDVTTLVDEKQETVLPIEVKTEVVPPIQGETDEIPPIEGKTDEILLIQEKTDEIPPIEGKTEEIPPIEVKMEDNTPVEGKIDDSLQIEEENEVILQIEEKTDTERENMQIPTAFNQFEENQAQVEPEESNEAPEQDQEASMDYFVTINPEDPDASSPRDSLDEEIPSEQEEPENNLRSELEASMDYPPAEEFSLRSEIDLQITEEEEDVVEKRSEQDSHPEVTQPEPATSSSSSEENSVIEVGENDGEDTEPEKVEDATSEDTQGAEVTEEQGAVETEGPSADIEQAVVEPVPITQEVQVETEQEQPTEQQLQQPEEPVPEKAEIPAPPKEDQKTEDDVKQEEVSLEKDASSATSSESVPAPERKARKNLETEEDKEEYRRAIAEKRREMKEKREQEERERKERIRLAKIEQAKREEEARKMFEEAAAAAEEERKQKEEEEKRLKEEEERRVEMEKKQEEEALAKKREASEKMKRDREAQKQKHEDERMARKKRLEMIMRRTRQPDAEPAKPTSRDNSASPTTTPSPQNTPVSISPAVGRSPQTQSPVGGQSPLISLTPERAVSPATTESAFKRNDNYLNIDVRTSTGHAANAANNNAPAITEENLKNKMQSQLGQDLVTFTDTPRNEPSTNDSGVELIHIDNVDVSTGNVEKPTPFEAFTTAGISNGVKSDIENHNKSTHNMDPFSLYTGIDNGTDGGRPTGSSLNGAGNLISMNAEIISPKVSTEPLVPSEI